MYQVQVIKEYVIVLNVVASHISYWKIGSAELASEMSYSVKNRDDGQSP
jgi:hypothetical protein